MAAAAEAAMAAAAASGSTGSYCRGQMPRVDDEQKGAKRKKKRQEIEEQKKNIFSRFSFRETASASDWLPPDFLSRQRPTDHRADATSRRRVGATLAALRRKSFGAASSFLAAAEVS